MNRQYPPWEQFPLAERERLVQLLVEVSLKQLPPQQEDSQEHPSQDSRTPSSPTSVRLRSPVYAPASAPRHRESRAPIPPRPARP
jgi:hypothetical protein